MNEITLQDLAGVAIAFAALLLSAINAWLTSKRSSKSEEISKEALETARKANEIAAETLLRVPVVSLGLFDGAPPLDETWVENGIQVRFTNHSTTAVSGIVFKISPLIGYTYRSNEPDDLAELPFSTRKLHFYEVLLKNAAAIVEISPYLYASIKDNLDKFSNPDSMYTAAFNIVGSPIQEGRDVAVSWRPDGADDRIIVNVRFVPTKIDAMPVDRLIDAAERKLKIFSGYSMDQSDRPG